MRKVEGETVSMENDGKTRKASDYESRRCASTDSIAPRTKARENPKAGVGIKQQERKTTQFVS